MANGDLGRRCDLCRPKFGIRQVLINEALNPRSKLYTFRLAGPTASEAGRENLEIRAQSPSAFFFFTQLGFFVQGLREPEQYGAHAARRAYPLGDGYFSQLQTIFH